MSKTIHTAERQRLAAFCVEVLKNTVTFDEADGECRKTARDYIIKFITQTDKETCIDPSTVA